MLCISNSTNMSRMPSAALQPAGLDQDRQMMSELFADLPEALANTLVVAQRCAVCPAQAQADPAQPCRATARRGCSMLIDDARDGLERGWTMPGSKTKQSGSPISTGSNSNAMSSTRWALPATS
jgi:DNA polymerase-3 subunit alpha